MRRLRLGIGIFLLVGLGLGVAIAQDDEQYAAIAFVVLRDYNGKPIKNASVIMHPVGKKGKQKNSGMQLKTNTDGKTSFDGIPYGALRVQVLAQGFQTYGEDYVVDKPELEITIKLKRPQGQYSVFEDHPEAKKDESKPDAKTPEEKPAEQKPQ
ncbi:MAG: carboxypeptidase regulatory-like domain-containing protein [Acidobacteria bacterium]|nr:carboxypeptidase regulatory-like domain-containing protein [Acidobacteriota bacterium]